MPVIGPRAAIDLALPTGIDASAILTFLMRSGKTAREIIAEAAAIIGAVNDELEARYGGIWYRTPMQYAMYALGGTARKTPTKVEFKQADPVRSDIIGHLLPLLDYEDAIGWTPIYLRDAYDAQITADLQLIADSWRNRVDSDVLTRIFSNAEVQIGTAGWSVPWAIGTGTNVNYIPPQYRSNQFTSSHTHFLYLNATWNASGAATLLENMVKELVHHGHSGRLVALVSQADVAIYAAIPSPKFVKFIPADVTIVSGGSTASATMQRELQGVPGEVFGLYLSDTGPVVELRAHERIPSSYAFVTKSYGVNNPRNGIAVREHPTKGFGLTADPQVTTSIHPELERVLFKAVHGVGINDRLNGVVGQGNAASYSAPTIS